MNTETKQQIKTDLGNYVAKVGSQNKASHKLNVSNATISNILADKWDNIAETMWLTIKNSLPKQEDWVIDERTKRMKLMAQVYGDAKDYSLVFGVIGKAGSGKTAPSKLMEGKSEVFVVRCKEFLNRKTFLAELLHAMGKDSGGYTVYELMAEVLSNLAKCDRPLIILDEADKLSDQVLYFFITIFNETEDKCGLVLQATEHLKKRILRGVTHNKKGYTEIYSRLGGKFIELPENSTAELKGITELNGVLDNAEQTRIANESEGDIRRLKRLVFAFRRKEAA